MNIAPSAANAAPALEGGFGSKALSIILRASSWTKAHPAKAFLLATAMFVAFGTILSIAAPEKAEAIPLLVPILVGGAILGAGLTAADTIEQMLRDAVNGLLAMAQTMVGSLASSDGLLKSFDELIQEVYPIIHNIHTAAVIPLANVVLAVFLVFALVKVMQTLGQNDAGIDLWRILMIFIFFAFAKVVVDNSWAIMTALYSLSVSGISGIMDQATLSGTFSVTEVDEDFGNTGLLIVMLLVSLVTVAVTFIVTAITHVVLIVRAIQLYVYTVFSPLPLACMVSESARSIATNFLKAFVALLLTGLILALLIVMFSFIAGNINVEARPDDAAGALNWCVQLLLNLVYLIAFGWAFLQSGNWARDFVGMIG